MSNNQSRTVTEILNGVEGFEAHEKKGGRFYYPMYLNRQMSETPIEALDLSVRSYNCLKRAGFTYIGELAEATTGGDILRTIRNCGTKSVREIREKMFIYQYEVLSPDKREKFLADVATMNGKCQGQ